MRPTLLLLGSIVVAITGCSIEQTRGLGDECLQTRECVAGLVCLPGSDGRNVCTAVSEAGTPGMLDVSTPIDTGTSDAAASIDVGGP